MKQLLLAIGLLGSSAAQAQSWHWGVQAGLGAGLAGAKEVPTTTTVFSLDGQNSRIYRFGRSYHYEGRLRAGGNLSLITRYDWRPGWQLTAGLRLGYQPVVVREMYVPASDGTEYLIVSSLTSGAITTKMVPISDLSPTTYHYRPLTLELPLAVRRQVGAHWYFEAAAGPRLTLTRGVRVDYKAGTVKERNEVVIVEKHLNTTDPLLKRLTWATGIGATYQLSERQELGLRASTTLGSLLDTRHINQPGNWQYQPPLIPVRLRLSTLEVQLTRWLR